MKEAGVCVFAVGDERFGLRLESMDEIVPMAALSRPPSCPAILEGLLNVRGTPVPVLRLAELMGLPPVELDLYTPLLIVHPVAARGSSHSLALLVSRVLAIAMSPEIRPAAKLDSFNGCVDGQIVHDGETVHVLSMDRLLVEREWRALSDFRAASARRHDQFESVRS